MIRNFDDGRSKSFYCIATTLLPISDLETSLDETGQRTGAHKLRLDDVKTKSRILKGFLEDFATREGIELKLRKKAKS